MPKKALLVMDYNNDFVHADGSLTCGAAVKSWTVLSRKKFGSFTEKATWWSSSTTTTAR